jgi:type III restriction enzyme
LPEDISDNLCIIVSTVQAFVHEETGKYNVYRHNEEMERHFGDISLEMGMESQDEESGGDPTKPKFSFANLLHHIRPIIIVDEAHHMVTDLSQKSLVRLNPSAVLGLTATPGRDNNVLYSVYAQELFDEEMVKLPIELTEYKLDWEKAVISANAKRAQLVKLAAAENAAREGKYIRPIVLFQATPKNGDVPVEKLKAYLTDTLKIPEEEIKIATGDQKELDDVNVMDPACKVNYVITVQALKEGWDCPFAYVFCSLANVGSSKDTIQLLGRVMRMPYAKRRKTRELNRAYAFVMSREFGMAAKELTEGLKKKGFSEVEAFKAVQENLPEMEGGQGELFSVASDVVKLDKETLDSLILPSSITIQDFASGDGEIQLSGVENDGEIEQVAEQLVRNGLQEKAHELKLKHQKKKAQVASPIPAKAHPWRFPRLCVEIDGDSLFSTDAVYETIGESILDFLPDELSANEISISGNDGKTFILKLDGNEMTARFATDAHTEYLKGFSGKIEESDVVNVLDGLTKDCVLLLQSEKRHWLSKIVSGLRVNHGMTCEQMVLVRYQIKQRVEWHLSDALGKARRKAYQQTFSLGGDYKLSLDLPGGFMLDETIYAGNADVYNGSWRFKKHYLGTYAIPKFDGKKPFGEGEEFECAKLIDSSSMVRYWLRNKDSDSSSFRLPMGGKTEWFYPDFIGELVDGRLFVLEYKGELTGQSIDTVEKTAIGKLWAEQDRSRYVYATINASDPSGLTMAQQIEAALKG